MPPERDLAQHFQTSRATIGQALRVLSALGLVDIQHGSGVYVTPEPDRLLRQSIDLLVGLDRDRMMRLVEARGWMEIAAVERAAHVATSEDVTRIQAASTRLSEERESIDRWLAIDIEFHRAVLLATGNSFVLTLVSPVLELMADARTHAYQAAGHDPAWFAAAELDMLVELHAQIACAIERHDAASALQLANAHQRLLVEHVATIDPGLP